MVLADKETDADTVDATIDLERGENDLNHHQCNHHHNSNSNHLTSLHDGCPISGPHYHPWDQDNIVYVPMIPFGDTSTRAGACIQVTGLQPVVPQSLEVLPQPDQLTEMDQESVERKPPLMKFESVADEPRDGGLPDNQQQQQHQQEESPHESLNVSTRELHNEIERKRRLRIKQCCDILRRLIPGLTEKTDKATVLEHTVDFVDHLFKCPNYKCVCYQNKK